MSFPRYSAYKESGFGWLKRIPAQWDCLAGRRVFRQVRELPIDGDVQLSATQKYGVVPQTLFMELEDQKVALALGGVGNFKRVKENDFVISLRSFQGGIEHSKYNGCVSPAYTVLRLTIPCQPDYLAYLLKSPGYVIALQSVTDGIRDGKNISYEQFGVIGLPIPPLDEQQAIATFLDHETAKIDALVAEQERLIELLKEKRQAVISHAVTKGLDPPVPMKDSGVEWLGEVPAHWDVTRMKFVAHVQTGIAKGKDTTGKRTIAVPYLRVANVQDGFLALDEVATIDIEPDQLDRYRLLPGDVLMNEGGDFDKLGRGAIWNGEVLDCIHQNHVFAVRPHGVSADWLNCVTSSQYAQFYFMGRSKQSTNLASISSSNIMELPVVLPPANEQAKVQSFIARETDRLDTLKTTAENAIALLQERRTALISAAVTGQIDVCGWVPAETAN